MDGFLLVLLVVLALAVDFLYKNSFYNRSVDDVCDFLGMLLVLKGAFIRMSARGHKLVCSPQKLGLAEDGLYAYTRNPMYLGTFLIGTGYILIVLPWWMVFVFAGLFYFRFSPLVASEQKHLKEIFGQDYENYCRRVPVFLPAPRIFSKLNCRKECPWPELWSTKEGRIIWVLPLIAIVAEGFHEAWFSKSFPAVDVFLPLFWALGVFVCVMVYEYFLKHEKNPE